MKKKIVIVTECLIACLLYCGVVLLSFDEKDTVFWTGFLFTLLAFVTELWVCLLNEISENKKGNVVLGLSILVLTTIYLIIQVVLSIIFMLTPVSFTAELVLEIVLTGFVYMLIIGSYTWKGSDERKVEGITEKRNYIQELYQEICLGSAEAQDDVVKKKMKMFADEIRYSDPISNASMNELEEQLKTMTIRIREHIHDEPEELLRCIDQARLLLKERNMRCKSEK